MADRKWEDEERRERMQALAGVMDFVGIVVGAVVILVLLAVFISLVSWLVNDVKGTFSVIFSRLS